MQTMFKVLLVATGLSLSLFACAENDKAPATEKPLTPTQPAAIDWENMSYDDWDSKLHFSDKCPAKYDGHAERFVNVKKLSGSASLLAIACKLGAYQDGNLLYRLKNGEIQPLAPALPKHDENWYLEVQDIVWGHQYTEGDYLVQANWYAGSGECGYRALYLIQDVVSQKSPKPVKVYGDVNCQDGVFLDDWPLIKELK